MNATTNTEPVSSNWVDVAAERLNGLFAHIERAMEHCAATDAILATAPLR